MPRYLAAGALVSALACASGGGSGATQSSGPTRPASRPVPSLEQEPLPPSPPRVTGCVPELEREWQRVRLGRLVPADVARAQVEQVLLADARVQVVQQAVGITVSSATSRAVSETMANGESREFRDSFVELYAQDAAGLIVEERFRSSRPSPDSLVVTYEARVACDPGSAPAGFTGRVEADRETYREGDAVRIDVEASSAARLFLFSVHQDGVANLIFPNQYDTLNLMVAGRRRTIPSPTAGYELPASLKPGLGREQAEMLLAIFYTGSGPAPFRTSDAFRVDFTLEQINRVLLRIPRAERARIAVGYEIRARQQR